MAAARGDGLSLCQALVQGACPVALFVGDLDALDRYVSMLLAYSDRQALDFWQAFGRCFQSVLTIRRGDLAEGVSRLQNALEGLREIRFGVYYGVFLCEFADALAHSGRHDDGRRAIDEALARAERNEERWYQPELLRIKGEIVLRAGRADAVRETKQLFQESLDWSRRQETPAWRLRTATSFARLHLSERRHTEARDVLAPAYAGFSQGLGTADLREAKALIDQLSGARAKKGGKRS